LGSSRVGWESGENWGTIVCGGKNSFIYFISCQILLSVRCPSQGNIGGMKIRKCQKYNAEKNEQVGSYNGEGICHWARGGERKTHWAVNAPGQINWDCDKTTAITICGQKNEVE